MGKLGCMLPCMQPSQGKSDVVGDRRHDSAAGAEAVFVAHEPADHANAGARGRSVAEVSVLLVRSYFGERHKQVKMQSLHIAFVRSLDGVRRRGRRLKRTASKPLSAVLPAER